MNSIKVIQTFDSNPLQGQKFILKTQKTRFTNQNNKL